MGRGRLPRGGPTTTVVNNVGTSAVSSGFQTAVTLLSSSLITRLYTTTIRFTQISLGNCTIGGSLQLDLLYEDGDNGATYGNGSVYSGSQTMTLAGSGGSLGPDVRGKRVLPLSTDLQLA